MDIVCFGQQNWDVCWTGKQQLMTRLAQRGHRVAYVNPIPATSVRDYGGHADALLPLRRDGAGLRAVADRLWTFTYPPPGLLGHFLNNRRGHHLMRALARRLHMTAPVAVVMHPGKRWLVEGLAPRATVYYGIDEWTQYPGQTDAQRRWLRDEEERLLRTCDVALGISPMLVDRYRALQPRAYVQPSGADVDHFSPHRLRTLSGHPHMASLPRPRVTFMGQVDERMDQDIVVGVARARRDWQVVLCGRVRDGADVSRLRAEPNIHFLGYQPYPTLPSVLKEADVAIVPYRVTDWTNSCSPLKVYEYLAAGLPVVTTPLQGLGASSQAVAVATDAAGFVAEIDRALADPDANRAARLAVARQNSWDERVDRLEDRLDEALAVAGGRPHPAHAVPPRRARAKLVLDPKDASQVQVRLGFSDERIRPYQRAFFHLTRAAGWAYWAARVASRAARGHRRPAAVRRILVVRRAYLGDLIAFLPTLKALRRLYPDARIVLGVQPNMSAAELLDGAACVDEVRPLDFMKSASRLDRLRGAWRLFREGYDLLVTGVSYFLLLDAYYCGAPKRLGLYDGHPLQQLNDRLVPLYPRRHEAESNLSLVEALGGPVPLPDRTPTLDLPPARLRAAEQRLADAHPLPPGARLVVVHAGSKRPSRRWPADRFAALLTRTLRAFPDVHVLLTGVADERPIVDAILADIPPDVRGRALSGVGRTDLAGMVALLNRSALVVSNDTGVMHLARAAGRPLVALLGPENDRRWGPYPRGAAPAITVRHEVPCAPCVRWDCDALYCLRSLTADHAFDAVRDLLAPTPARLSLPVMTCGTVERRATHLRWRDLADAGFALPRVHVVLLAADAADAAAALAGLLRRTSAALDAADYPDLLLSAVVPPAHTAAARRAAPDGVPVWPAAASRLSNLRRAATSSQSPAADYVLPLRPAQLPDLAWVPDAVASLVRSPMAVATSRTAVFTETSAPDLATADDLLLLRHDWLAQATATAPADPDPQPNPQELGPGGTSLAPTQPGLTGGHL